MSPAVANIVAIGVLLIGFVASIFMISSYDRSPVWIVAWVAVTAICYVALFAVFVVYVISRFGVIAT